MKGNREENSYIYMKNTRRKFKNQQGFNLIELMIVIAIIALLIGVGIPAWQAMVRAGNETTAAQTINTIRTCQNSYSGKHKGEFADFPKLVESGCLDGDKFKDNPPIINGYTFTLKTETASSTKAASYKLNADPQSAEGVGATGKRHFYFDSNLGAVKATEENRPATEQDPSM